MAKQKVDKKSEARKDSLRAKLKKTVSSTATFLNETDLYDIDDYFDTGSLALNAQISGDPYRGLPSNCMCMLVGESSSGKSIFAENIAISAQKKGYLILKYETEGSGDKISIQGKGLDINDLMIEPIATVEELTTSLIKMLDEKDPEEKLLVIIDSIGNIASKKELDDNTEGNDKRDMTKQQKLKSLFRTVMIKAFKKKCPMVIVNHVYANIGGYGGPVISGGNGAQYASSITLSFTKSFEVDEVIVNQDEIDRINEQNEISKKEAEESGKKFKPKKVKEKKEKKTVASIITSTAVKNRFAKEKTRVKVGLSYKYGIQKTFGLFDMMMEAGYIISPNLGWYVVKGEEENKMRRKDFNGKIYKRIFDMGFYEWMKSEFKYNNQLNPDDLLEDSGELDNVVLDNEK